ncbi:hypothetical protein CUJ83_13270 [Methanocella sp. CWC-04]|uniref:Uncharacterized protein n=1 Tax=Methanooceanicella nereidis TaxID=2052831 RepID=A0AAP2RGU7_9EURY|nr:hypothetical protein [Methanocella sp. CWC-04]MCD1295967.1 hypothetical protein [Methanocella sp. CWC-04]
MYPPEPEDVREMYLSIIFDAEELEVIKLACTMQSSREDELVDDAAGIGMDEMIEQAAKANEMYLISETIVFMRPGQETLMRSEDLLLIKNSLKNYRGHASEGLSAPLESAIAKIDLKIKV